MKKKNKLMVWPGYYLLSVLTIILTLAVIKVRRMGIWTGHLPAITTAGMFLCITGVCMFLMWKKQQIDEDTITHIIFCGVLLRLFYIVLTAAFCFQNDLGDFAPDNSGHLGYLYHLYTTGHLPGNGNEVIYQEYQPPFHYMVSAMFLKGISFFGVNIMSKGDEFLQILPVIYSAIIMVVMNKLGKKLGIDVFARAICMGLMAFLPYQMYEGGALNNDPLMTMLTILSIYVAILWYEKTTSAYTVALALCIGLAMMTKLSGALVAPAIGVLMLKKFWDNRKEWKYYVGQFALFGVLVFPLGLWYSIWRYLQCGMPLGFVPAPGTDQVQYMGEVSVWKRLFDFSGAFDQLSLCWNYESGAGDKNIFVSLVKFSVFGSNDYYRVNGATLILGTILFWTTLLLFAGIVVGTIVWLLVSKTNGMYRFLLGGIAIVYVVFYIRFCVQYPFLCTMDIRYILVALYIGMLCLGAVLSGFCRRLAGQNEHRKAVLEKTVFSLMTVYFICAALLTVNMELLIG